VFVEQKREWLMKRRWLSILAVALILGAGSALSLLRSSKAVVPYPEGYREWVHIKTMVIQEGHPLYEAFGGIHHIYANDKALQAYYGNTRKFPDGSVIVFDLLEARQQDNAIVEGKRKVVGVMVKDSKRFAETGGWGFEGFKGNTRQRVVTDPKAGCFNCHASQQSNDFVFSRYRQ